MLLDLMIDIETLSILPTAAVTQIGWCTFDPRGDEIAARGCFHLDVQAQIDRGLTVDWSTIEWWLKQEKAAQEVMVQPGRMLPSDALRALAVIYESQARQVWSHGSVFDIVIIENLYRRAQLLRPWNFRDIRDTRTLFWLAGDKLKWPENPVKHSAEADAVAQATAVQRAMKIVERRE